jgi:16S rRNA pseudouridine516 synthase
MLANAPDRLSAEIPASAFPLRLHLGGQPLEIYDSFHLMLHKPVGCVTALTDGRYPTAASFLAGAPLLRELRPVGRLDLDTSGLLLWTTDGNWLHRLAHPRTAVPRGYHAALSRPFRPLPADLVLRDGHRPRILDLRRLPTEEIHPGLLRPEGQSVFAAITIVGGAYHEVRRIFAALGSHVLGLCRVSFGNLALPRELTAGDWRPVARENVGPGPPP